MDLLINCLLLQNFLSLAVCSRRRWVNFLVVIALALFFLRPMVVPFCLRVFICQRLVDWFLLALHRGWMRSRGGGSNSSLIEGRGLLFLVRRP